MVTLLCDEKYNPQRPSHVGPRVGLCHPLPQRFIVVVLHLPQSISIAWSFKLET